MYQFFRWEVNRDLEGRSLVKRNSCQSLHSDQSLLEDNSYRNCACNGGSRGGLIPRDDDVSGAGEVSCCGE